MIYALVMVVDIPTMLAPQVTKIRCFDIQAMLASQNTACQILLMLYIINKKEKQKKVLGRNNPNKAK